MSHSIKCAGTACKRWWLHYSLPTPTTVSAIEICRHQLRLVTRRTHHLDCILQTQSRQRASARRWIMRTAPVPRSPAGLGSGSGNWTPPPGQYVRLTRSWWVIDHSSCTGQRTYTQTEDMDRTKADQLAEEMSRWAG